MESVELELAKMARCEFVAWSRADASRRVLLLPAMLLLLLAELLELAPAADGHSSRAALALSTVSDLMASCQPAPMSNPWAQQASSASAAQTNQSNNPFAPRAPTHREQAEQRFPAVEQQQQQQHEQGGASSSMLSPQQTAYGQQQYGGMQPQQTGYMQPQRTGFVPSSSFGQQLRAEMDMYGGPSPYQQQQQQSSFTGSGNFSGGSSGASQPVSQGVLSQFDPYAGLSALVDSQASSTSAPSAAQPSAAAQSAAQALPPAPSQPTMDVHPRDFVLQNKALLSSWNDPAWKALLAKVRSSRSQLPSSVRHANDPSLHRTV